MCFFSRENLDTTKPSQVTKQNMELHSFLLSQLYALPPVHSGLPLQVDSCVVWPYDGPTGEVDLETPPEQALSGAQRS